MYLRALDYTAVARVWTGSTLYSGRKCPCILDHILVGNGWPLDCTVVGKYTVVERVQAANYTMADIVYALYVYTTVGNVQALDYTTAINMQALDHSGLGNTLALNWNIYIYCNKVGQ
jgi:hypothetical protein